MKVYELKKEQYFNHSIEKVFDFFSKPENLAVITPDKMNFTIITPLPILMGKGKIIDYTIKIFGFLIRWRSIISSYNIPNGFTDEQLLGPYSFWHHTHRFEKHQDGTLMTDTVTYVMPFGWLGRLTHWVSVRHQLKNIFDYRERKLGKIFSEEKKYGVKI